MDAESSSQTRIPGFSAKQTTHLTESIQHMPDTVLDKQFWPTAAVSHSGNHSVSFSEHSASDSASANLHNRRRSGIRRLASSTRRERHCASRAAVGSRGGAIRLVLKRLTSTWSCSASSQSSKWFRACSFLLLSFAGRIFTNITAPPHICFVPPIRLSVFEIPSPMRVPLSRFLGHVDLALPRLIRELVERLLPFP